MHRIVSMRADRASGSGGRNPVHAVKAANFLDQIDLAFQIDAKGWHSDGASLRASFAEDLKAQAVQISDVLRGGNVRPEHLGSLLMAERDCARLDWPRISVHDSVGQLPASGLQDQLRREEAGPITNAHVGSAFEAVRGLGSQIELLGGGAN